MARILVHQARTPFTKPTVAARELIQELRAEGHEVDLIELPHRPEAADTSDELERWRSLDLSKVCGTTVDLVIATCVNSFEVTHPNKVIWTPGATTRTWNLKGG
jgi:hypothetical protein